MTRMLIYLVHDFKRSRANDRMQLLICIASRRNISLFNGKCVMCRDHIIHSTEWYTGPVNTNTICNNIHHSTIQFSRFHKTFFFLDYREEDASVVVGWLTILSHTITYNDIQLQLIINIVEYIYACEGLFAVVISFINWIKIWNVGFDDKTNCGSMNTTTADSSNFVRIFFSVRSKYTVPLCAQRRAELSHSVLFTHNLHVCFFYYYY